MSTTGTPSTVRVVTELRPGDVVLVKASNAAGLGALAEALVADPDTGFGDGMGEDDRK